MLSLLSGAEYRGRKRKASRNPTLSQLKLLIGRPLRSVSILAETARQPYLSIDDLEEFDRAAPAQDRTVDLIGLLLPGICAAQPNSHATNCTRAAHTASKPS